MIVILAMIVVMRRRRIMLDDVVAWHVMSVSIAAVEFIADGMVAPVGMNPFPVVETRRAVNIQSQPDVVGSQIVILAAHNADIFDPVPDISIRNTYFHRYCRWCWCWHDYHGGWNLHRDHRPGQQWQDRET